jgi:hypothetical protein
MKKTSLFFVGCFFVIAFIAFNNSNFTTLNKPARVTIENTNGKYTLLVNNEPFYINGAGLEFGNIESLAKYKGNSFRTWRTNNGKNTALEVLDEAHKHGLMVTMGIEVARERHGFDYNDQEKVDAQRERIREEVNAIKDHPALLIWSIGNELNLRYSNPNVWNAVNDISKMIHEIDPNHPTTTTLAGISKREILEINKRAPELDILSFQVYGELGRLPKQVRSYGWTKPYMVTEWGATGHWEVPRTKWGAPIEENSTVKAKNYMIRYQKSMQIDSTHCLGSYVFLWGQKQERTPTWYGVFTEDDKATESVDVMQYLWTGEWPENRSPQIKSFLLDGKDAYSSVTLQPNQSYEATVVATDPNEDPLTYSYEILHESTDLKDGGDFEERPSSVQWKKIISENGKLRFTIPQEEGTYRIFVYVHDNKNHVGTANIPFRVNKN